MFQVAEAVIFRSCFISTEIAQTSIENSHVKRSVWDGSFKRLTALAVLSSFLLRSEGRNELKFFKVREPIGLGELSAPSFKCCCDGAQLFSKWNKNVTVKRVFLLPCAFWQLYVGFPISLVQSETKLVREAVTSE